MLGDGRVRVKRGTNVGVQGFEVHDCGCLEYQSVEYGCLEGGCKLLVSKHWSKSVRVNSCITPFPVMVVTPSQLGTLITPVMSPDFTYYSGSSS